MSSRQVTDPDVQLLASIAASLRSDYEAADLTWEGSPFAWIKARPSRQVGTIGEALVAGWCAARGLDVAKSPDSDADRVIAGVRTEIKFSTLWSSGFYKFQQLRNQDYGIAICLGVSPFDAHCWALPKAVIMAGWGKAEGLTSQHGGAAGKDTAWLQVTPTAIPAWLSPYGGRLRDAIKVIEKYSRSRG